MSIIKTLIVVLALSLAAFAGTCPSGVPSGVTACFYISSAGSDSATGADEAHPWAHAPGMVTCASNCAANTPSAGRGYIFRGGETWASTNFNLVIAWSGSSGAPIYYGVDPLWFSGGSWARPIFNGGGTHLASGDSLITISNENWITIDNLELTNLNAYDNFGPANIQLSCDTNVLMSNLYVHNWALDSSVSTDDAHGGIFANNPSCDPVGVVIDHSVISNSEHTGSRQNGVAIRAIDMQYSVLHDVSTAQLFGRLHDSLIYNVSYPSGNQTFDNTYHTNVTYLAEWGGNGQRPTTNAYIYNNVIHDFAAGSGGLYPNECTGSVAFYMWNNVIYNNFSGNANIQIEPYGGSSGCGHWYVWNNTLQVPVGGGTNAIRIVPRGFPVGTVALQNIHYVTDSGSFSPGDGVNSLTNANNISQSNATATGQGYTGAEAYAYSPTTSSGSTVNAGTNLTSNCSGSLSSLCTDTSYGVSLNLTTHSAVSNPRTTIPRPSSSAWNAGAYQFTTGGGGGGANFPYGSNCQGGCGIGSGIITSSINIYLYDSNPADAQIQASTSISGYNPASFPPTIDPTKMWVDFDSTTPGVGCAPLGVLLNTTNATYCETDGAGHYVVSTHHHVLLEHIVPANSNGTGGGPTTFYVCSSTNGSTSNPGGTVLAPNYGNGWSCYPGPQGVGQGRQNYFNVYFPNPGANLPMQWELTSPGQMSATPMTASGAVNATNIPLMLLWKNGNATTAQGTAGLGPCTSAQLNYVGHLYNASSTPYSAPNSGTWYTCNGSAWTQNASNPIWVWTSSITQGGNTYNCAANANGGLDPSSHMPTGTCKTTGGSDSGIAIVPFYAGTWVSSSPSTDYRQIGLTNGKYSFDMNGAAPPLNPQPTSVASFIAGPTAITGSMTVNLTGVLYTSATGATQAAGTSPVTLTYPITVAAPVSLSASAPTPSVDPNLPAYFAFNATSAVNMNSNSGFTCSLAWWEQNIHTWQWFPFGAGSFAECNTWNYDNSRVFTSASDQFTHKMDGTAWPTSWTGTHTYGDNYADEIICPSSDTNGNCWVSTNASCLTGGSCGFTSGGSEPSWVSHSTVGSTVSDGGGSWINAGKQSYWNRAVNNSGQPYLNNLVLTDGGVSQFSQFTGGLDKNRQRTGDAIAKSGTTVNGLYGVGELQAINGDFGGGTFNVFSTNAGRGAAYELDTLLTYWRTSCQRGNCGNFTGNNAIQRLLGYDLNSTLNYWDFFLHQPQFSTDPVKAYGPVIIPFYIGLGMEAVAELESTCDELDHAHALAICQDSRAWPALNAMTDYMWVNWWDGVFKAGEGFHNYSFSYDPRDIQNHTISEPFLGTDLIGPVEPTYDLLYRAFGGNPSFKLSDGTPYDVAADQIRMHQFDGRNCNNWTCFGGTHSFGHPWSGGTGSPKLFGQANKWGLGNSYNWRLGFSSPLETDLTPSRNPCWDSGTVPCSGSHPYPDTQAPYMFQIINPGSSGQDDPGAEGHFTGRTDSPIQNVTSTSAQVQFWTYEATTATRVSYGANPTCNTGSVSTEDAGYPQSQNLAAVTTYLHHFTLTGLSPSTNYFVQLSATDAAGNTATNSCSAQSQQGGGINFTTLASTGPVILTSSLPNGSVGTSYSTTLQGGGGFPPYTFTVTGTLPPGLTFSTPTISGTPTGTVGGNYPLTLGMSDSHGTNATPVNTSITISALHFTTTSLSGGTKSSPYSDAVAATGGTGSITYSALLGILPPGLSLNATTGAITGTPTACGTYTVTFHARDTAGNTANTVPPLSIVVGGCSALLTLTCPTFPSGVVDQVYPTQSCTIVGGVSPYTCSISAGSLPTGLSIGTSGSTCTISGTPTATGSSSFTVHVHDSTGTPLTADSPGSINVISTSQLGVSVTGNVTINGNVTAGTPVAPPTNP